VPPTHNRQFSRKLTGSVLEGDLALQLTPHVEVKLGITCVDVVDLHSLVHYPLVFAQNLHSIFQLSSSENVCMRYFVLDDLEKDAIMIDD
jgi:hypothetical protein